MVTGASRGRRAARPPAASPRTGYDVALLARGEEGLEGARGEVEAAGRRALPLSTDVAEPAQVEEAAERCERELGPIDLWVNNAMTTIFSPLSEIEPEEFRRATEVTYLGTVWGTMAALRQDAAAQSEARSCSSAAPSPIAGSRCSRAYCGAKHAIKGFFESVRTELIHEGSEVDISIVELPGLNTPQFDHCRTRLPKQPQPVPPIYEPEVAAEGIAWIAQNDERELYVGAPTWKTILGNKVAPGIVDLYLAKTAYSGQQADEPVNGDRPDNLFEPVERDEGAHGPFDGRSRSRSPLLWMAKNRRKLGAVTLAGAGITAAAATALIRRD